MTVLTRLLENCFCLKMKANYHYCKTKKRKTENECSKPASTIITTLAADSNVTEKIRPATVAIYRNRFIRDWSNASDSNQTVQTFRFRRNYSNVD